ncbi:hypothetical protein IZ6_27780 [Terrihabitans soli]|uniref:DUF1194 domain-containing protein n=1 Tax=Terrihabitans soli TaxID=708113 RepID=A0A6S6QL36_9HYPH|nr:DUF1194 domain-containing protein [Terrihabitans soli]BCJ92043.1 hypothetical protein IZ6_27780 [Terrihabitans soli]
MRILTLVALMFGLTGTAAAQMAAGDANTVDLELVLAVDISYSMDEDELRLQREGYVAAITSKPVIDAIKEGVYGRIAVAYVEWAGTEQQNLLIDWQIIDGPGTAQAFADKLAESSTNRAYRTSISAALDFSSRLFAKNAYEGTRRVIDISGDGPNNQGNVVTFMRDLVVSMGIGINGLPLALKAPNSGSVDIQNLEAYYRECVIGGPGAFVIPVAGKNEFAEAIRTKLVLEISAIEPQARVIPVQNKAVNCMMGEKIWRDRYGDGIQDNWQ